MDFCRNFLLGLGRIWCSFGMLDDVDFDGFIISCLFYCLVIDVSVSVSVVIYLFFWDLVCFCYGYFDGGYQVK
jgi:hypothetical protein